MRNLNLKIGPFSKLLAFENMFWTKVCKSKHFLSKFGIKRYLSSSNDIVPVIDLEPFLNGSLHDRRKVANQIGQACEEVGFFAIRNHGVSQSAIDNILRNSKEFFDLPAVEKEKLNVMTEEYPYGYNGIMKEILSKGKDLEDGTCDNLQAADLKESFSMGPYNPNSGMKPPIFPAQPPNFSISFLQYYKEMEKLSASLLRAFALALDLPEMWFEDKTDRHCSCIRSMCDLHSLRNHLPHFISYIRNYPDQSTQPGQLRASAHTDYGSMTILLQDLTGGLQVLSKNNTWCDVVPIPGVFVINLGDLMARWTNRKWVSTNHRVVEPNVRGRRQSIAFFHNINADHNVECIETCTSHENPPQFPPITAHEHLIKKHMASIKN